MMGFGKKIKVALFALTGFGNTVLNKLLNSPVVDDIIVYTLKERYKFPHYYCEPLIDVCKSNKIETYTDVILNSAEFLQELQKLKPDIILVATFNQKVPKKIIDLPSRGVINIHPSLLPHYRGATPTNWAIINGEKESGITFHHINEEFDMGDILFQQRIQIGELTDGELRKSLAELSGKWLEPFLKLYLNGEIKPIVQCKEEGSYYPKITSSRGIELLKSGKYNKNNLIRGLTPCWGPEILL